MDRRQLLSFLLAPVALLAGRRGRTLRVMRVSATAHSVEGETASGTLARPGTVAADPRVLPLGSRIRVSGAGGYSGVYTVTDTGRSIKGREIDLYMPSNAEAKKFGRQTVKVTVLQYGERSK